VKNRRQCRRCQALCEHTTACANGRAPSRSRGRFALSNPGWLLIDDPAEGDFTSYERLSGGRITCCRYLAPDGNLIAAELKETNGLLQVVALRRLFQTKANSLNDSYDAFPDGKKFLVSTVANEETPTPLNLVLNWPAELEKWALAFCLKFLAVSGLFLSDTLP
jgi:hypothetical protein